MKIPFVDLKAQYTSLRNEINGAIQTVIDDLAFVGNMNNSYIRKFEEEFAAFSKAKHCIACGNGTDAIEILLKAAGIGDGDQVIVPAISWIATSEAVTNVGATPIFADIEENTFTISPSSIIETITPTTKAIIPVHLYGNPCDMDAICKIADDHNLIVIEDCAQAHGAEYKSKSVGTFGAGGTFSFFPGKNLGAYGDAGGIITNNSFIAEKSKMISQHGQSESKHDHKIEGRNSRMDGIQAAILSVKLPLLTNWTDLRIEHAEKYRKSLKGLEITFQESPSFSKHVYHLFATLQQDREVIRSVLNKNGVATGVQYPTPLPLLTAYKNQHNRPEEFPNAIRLSKGILTLPIFPELQSIQTDYICDHLRQNCLVNI